MRRDDHGRAGPQVLSFHGGVGEGRDAIVGVEDMVVVTDSGGVSLNRFEKEPLALSP